MQRLRAITFVVGFALVVLASDAPRCAYGDSGYNRGPQGAGQFWVSAEYLHWQTSGMKIPALVTGNPLGTPLSEAGIIGSATTRVLVGNETILDGFRPGIGLAAGGWLTCNLGAEVDYFGFSNEGASYRYDENSNLIIGRPFINLSPLPIGSDPRYDSQLVIFPNQVTGSLRISASSELQGYGARLKFSPFRDCCSRCISCSSGVACDDPGSCDGQCEPGCGSESSCDRGCQPTCFSMPRCNSCTFDFSIGYRHLSLNEHLQVSEQLVSSVDQFDLYDRFQTESRFNGMELGLNWSCQYLCFYLDTFGRLGVGINDNRVRISGQTTDRSNGFPNIQTGGILAQSSNIGSHDQDVASMMLQLGFSGSCHVANGVSLSAGYSFLYWGNVVQAGSQIDPSLHPDLFPPATAPLGTIGAKPTHKLSDFVGHGLNLGIVYVF